MGVEGASFNGFVNDESLWNLFWCFLCKFYYRSRPILKTLGQFQNLGFAIMSTRENIRLIARTPLPLQEILIFIASVSSWDSGESAQTHLSLCCLHTSSVQIRIVCAPKIAFIFFTNQFKHVFWDKLGAQKNRLIETVLLCTQNICFGWEIRKTIFKYTLLSGDLKYIESGCRWRFRLKFRPLARRICQHGHILVTFVCMW